MLGVFFFVFGFLFIVFIFLTIWTTIVWAENKKCHELIESENFEVFENLKISSLSYGKIKSSQGFTISGKIGISNDTLVFTASHKSFYLIQTELPFIFCKSKGFVPEQVKMNNWNSITIIVHKDTMRLGQAKIEFLIETTNREQKENLYNKIKNWC
jgi:hypothetical protein